MKRLKHILLSLLSLSVLVSCDNDTLPVDSGQEQSITLSVSLDKGAMSRAAIGTDALDDENYIIGGEYGIFVGINDQEKVLGLPNVHCCRFTSDRKGQIYPMKGGTLSTSPLRWSDEQVDKKDFEFILDNMGYDKTCTWNEETEFLGWEWDDTEKNVTYAIQRENYDAENKPTHTNDIIWGRGTAKYGTDGKTPSKVELTHRMTRLNVVFSNLDATLNDEQRQGMTVKVTNLVQTAESFNRYNGKVAIADSPVRADVLIKPAGEDLVLIQENGSTLKEYSTANYILPPQPLDVNKWPKVEVTYTKDGETKTVSGLIPRDIYYEIDKDNVSWVTLDELQAGNHLTVVVEIKEGIPDIIFTAKVKKWVEIGPMTVRATQRKPGINSIEELEDCIRMYNSLPVFKDPTVNYDIASRETKTAAMEERFLLYLYGKSTEPSWNVFQWEFPINFELSEADLNQLPKFRNIMYNEFRLYQTPYTAYPLVLTSTENTAEELDKLKGAKGIYNLEDLRAMITTVEFDMINLGAWYGTLSEQDDTKRTATYTFDLWDNITGSVEKLLPEVIGGYTITYVMKTNGFTVNDSGNVWDLVKKRGVYNIDDLNAMITAVKTNILSADAAKYGVLNADQLTYTFDLRANITGTVTQKLPQGVTVGGTYFPITYLMNANGFTIEGITDVNDLIEQ